MTKATTSKGGSPWLRAIVIGLVLVILANLAFVYIAVRGSDPVAASYDRR